MSDRVLGPDPSSDETSTELGLRLSCLDVDPLLTDTEEVRDHVIGRAIREVAGNVERARVAHP